MKRALRWAAAVAAAFLCALSGLYVYRVLLNYNSLQDGLDRQLIRLSAAQAEQAAAEPLRADMPGVADTVTFLSAQITDFSLTEQSLMSEKGELDQNGWEEWKIKAVCTGSIDDLNAFIGALESSGAYHGIRFTLDAGGDNINGRNNGPDIDAGAGGGEIVYELNIELGFYTRRV